MNESMDVSAVAEGGRVAPVAPEPDGIETTEAGKRLTRAARWDGRDRGPVPPGFTSPDRESRDREPGGFADESDTYTPARAWGADSQHPSAGVSSGLEEVAHLAVDSADHGPAPAFRGTAGGPGLERDTHSESLGAAAAE